MGVFNTILHVTPDINSNPTSGALESTVGKSIDNLLKVDDDTYSHLASNYDPTLKLNGVIDGAGASAITGEGSDSIFNPFYLFRFAKYGNIVGPSKGYSVEYHRDINPISDNKDSQKGPLTLINEDKKAKNNPTASTIIAWASTSVDQSAGNTIGPTPYQWNDFLWCKWYGKIPNNRLLTLRRYPIPVEDNLQILQQKMPLIPLAQAVTWWGDDTGNSLENILGISYALNWTKRESAVTDVTGNEIKADDLLNKIGIQNQTVRQVLLATMFSEGQSAGAFSGLDKGLQDYMREAYTKGPYWNRILGPVNVINSTKIRDVGFTFTHSIKLNFSYKLRSFNNVNPKIAMLDLITNFLTLTYNTAEFWGGANRYFPQPGVILQGLPQGDFDKANYFEGIKKTLVYALQKVQGTGKEMSDLIDAVGRSVTTGDLDKAMSKIESSSTARAIAGSWVKNLIQMPLLMRSYLDGRAVGEWHLTVGNPMEPIATIGNLILTNSSMKFSNSLGLDDFPTEVSFSLTLESARPRAKQDIESMFNLGGGPFSWTKMPQLSTDFNSLGERNSIVQNALRGYSKTDANSKDAALANNKSFAEINKKVDEKSANDLAKLPDAQNTAAPFRYTVRRAYGEKFSKSEVLVDYFIDLKTKD